MKVFTSYDFFNTIKNESTHIQNKKGKQKMTTKESILKYVEWYKEKHEMDENPIFEIFLFQHPNKELTKEKDGKTIHLGFPDFGASENCGFYYDIDDSIKALNENWCDIQEHLYHAAFILCHFPGLYSSATLNERMYFVWDTEKRGFFQQEEPEIFAHTAI